MRWWTILAASVACGGPVAPQIEAQPNVRQPSEPEPVLAPPQCVLPTERPADLVVGAEHTQLAHGSGRSRFVVELLSEGTACGLDLNCVSTASPVLDTVWAEFVAADFARMKAEPLTGGSPHTPGRSLWLRWGDQRCEVSYGSLGQLAADPKHRFDALDDLVFELATEHSPTPLLQQMSP